MLNSTKDIKTGTQIRKVSEKLKVVAGQYGDMANLTLPGLGSIRNGGHCGGKKPRHVK